MYSRDDEVLSPSVALGSNAEVCVLDDKAVTDDESYRMMMNPTGKTPHGRLAVFFKT